MSALSDEKTKALYDCKDLDGRSWLYHIPNEKRPTWKAFVLRTLHDYEKIKNKGKATEAEYNNYLIDVNAWLAAY